MNNSDNDFVGGRLSNASITTGPTSRKMDRKVVWEAQHNMEINRPIFYQEALQENLDYNPPTDESVFRRLKECCKNKNCKKFLETLLPISLWLSEYNWKTDFAKDLIAGFTIAIMHIPQGMAYALLANVPAIVGMYMAFFPVLAYAFLGTSRHVSMGTFAVISLMTGKVVLEHATEPLHSEISTDVMNETSTANLEEISRISVATIVCFCVGIVQLIMYVFRLGILSCILSESLVNGFTSGAACHVLMSQMKDLFGIKIDKHPGPFTLIYTVISMFENMIYMNGAAVILSAISIIVLSVTNQIIKPRLAKITILPLPIELIVVIAGTLVSKYLQLEGKYNVTIVGPIPNGIPAPQLPPLNLIGPVFTDSVIIAIVAYTIALSMGLIFAQKNKYEIDANQELFAQGASNLLGSFFLCLPISASLTRSLIQDNIGGKTQMVSIVSCILVLLVLLFIGPLFETLPKAVLASIIVVALKGMFVQMKLIKKLCRVNKLDAFVWTVTFFTTVIVNVDIGLFVGIFCSMGLLIFEGIKPNYCLMGHVPGTDLYVDINRYGRAVQVKDVKIFRYCGMINFATKHCFQSSLYETVGINPLEEYQLRRKSRNLIITEGKDNKGFHTDFEANITNSVDCFSGPLKFIIVDCSSLHYIDPTGVDCLKVLIEDFDKIDIRMLFAGCSDPVYETLKKCDLAKEKELIRFFPTIHDAVESTTPIITDITPL